MDGFDLDGCDRRNGPGAERMKAARDRAEISVRLAHRLRPLDRTTAPVDGLPLFDQVRSPTMI